MTADPGTTAVNPDPRQLQGGGEELERPGQVRLPSSQQRPGAPWEFIHGQLGCLLAPVPLWGPSLSERALAYIRSHWHHWRAPGSNGSGAMPSLLTMERVLTLDSPVQGVVCVKGIPSLDYGSQMHLVQAPPQPLLSCSARWMCDGLRFCKVQGGNAPGNR